MTGLMSWRSVDVLARFSRKSVDMLKRDYEVGVRIQERDLKSGTPKAEFVSER